MLYRLARHRNAQRPTIPLDLLEKKTTAQQRDDTDLPPYAVLDLRLEPETAGVLTPRGVGGGSTSTGG